ncbi:MAG: glycosyltransferase family 39 protein [Bacteroidota bacterium]
MKINLYELISKKLNIQQILGIAIILRLIAVIFAKGYGYHDDHFLIVEAAQSWADGYDYNDWLPWNQVNPKPEGHSFFYVGIHYCLFCMMNLFSFLSTDSKMFIIRLIHAIYSLSIVYFAYKITEKISDISNAKIVAFILAILWLMPWLSVRNLVEMVCIPFLLWSTWLVYKNQDTNKLFPFLLAGFIAGFAFSTRFQTSVYIIGMGIVILYLNKFPKALLFTLGTILSVVLIQGGIDFFIWGRPFAEMQEYVMYNIANKDAYITNAWYSYMLVLTGLLLLPLGIVYWYGMYKSIHKKTLLIFVPTLFFLVFHSLYPNKQERFIFTLLPMFVILGQTGLYIVYNNGDFKTKKILNNFFIIFLVMNALLVPLSVTYYSKKARVESMAAIQDDKNANTILVEYSNSAGNIMLPSFYSKKWLTFYNFSLEKINPSDTNLIERRSAYVFEIKNPVYLKEISPDYIYFISDKNIAARVNYIESSYGKLSFLNIFKPGFLDKLLHKANPINKNEAILVYKVKRKQV